MNPQTEADEDKSPNDIKSEWYQSLHGRIEEAIKWFLDFREENPTAVNRYSLKAQWAD